MEGSWRFKVEKTFRSCMYRPITECIRIRRLQNKGVEVINLKEEYSRSFLPQLEVSLGGKMMLGKVAKEAMRIYQDSKRQGGDPNNIYGENKRQSEDQGGRERKKTRIETEICTKRVEIVRKLEDRIPIRTEGEELETTHNSKEDCR